ncbi:MAG: S8 family peptidase [Flavobacteriales bacterium]|nr:S8 family peptidase [Flavobacteriales bacterium]
MRLTVLCILLCSSVAIRAQVAMPAISHAGISELNALSQHLSDPQKLTDETQGRFPTAMVHGRCTVGFLGKVDASFDPASVSSNAVSVGSRVGDIVSFRVDAYHLSAVNDIPGLAYAELAGCAAPHLDRAVRATRADSVQRGINLPQSYTGRNVLIGVLDWGFDYTHPMFYDTTLTTSRVRAAWDQFRQAGPGPSAFGYGTELTNTPDLMAAQSDTANIYSFATHGTHVSGIAGGSGAGTQYRGFAFDAQFVFCTWLIDAAGALDGFAWMKSVADLDQKRLVVNCSWGLYYMGTLDGNSLISQAINQLSQQGVVFCNSGGNNGDVNFHLKKNFGGDTLRSIIQIYPYSAHPKMWGQSITMWGDVGAEFAAGITITNNANQMLAQSPWYHTSTQSAYVDTIIVIGTDTVFYNITADAAHPLNGRPHMRLRVKNTNGALKIQLKQTAATGLVHSWNVTELSNGVGNWGQAFLGGVAGTVAGDKNYGISEPACTESTITVAAYSSEYYLGQNNTPVGGAIATFSSFGPTFDERAKPDITAPGVSVISSISLFTDNSYTLAAVANFQGQDYPFAAFSGTSMSSPAVTGIVALILEADPTITAAEVHALLKATARTDNQTGTIPPGGSTRWGMGKVNAYRAVSELLGVVSVPSISDTDILVWPNPARSILNISTGRNGVALVTIMDIAGRVVRSARHADGNAIAMDVLDLPTGTYSIRVEQADRSIVSRWVKQ